MSPFIRSLGVITYSLPIIACASGGVHACFTDTSHFGLPGVTDCYRYKKLTLHIETLTSGVWP